MNAVTLETLRADFEAKRLDAHLFLTRRLTRIFGSYDGARIFIEEEPEHFASWEPDQNGVYHSVREAALLYMVARNEGLNAAMLWKLAHGGDA